MAFIRPDVADPDGLRLIRFADEAMLIALPQTHALAMHKTLPLSALHQQSFIMFPRVIGMSLYDEVMLACRTCGFDPQVGQHAPQITSLINLVSAGVGVSVVPESLAQVRVKGVVYIPISGHAPVARLAFAYRQRSAVLTNFMNTFKK